METQTGCLTFLSAIFTAVIAIIAVCVAGKNKDIKLFHH